MNRFCIRLGLRDAINGQNGKLAAGREPNGIHFRLGAFSGRAPDKWQSLCHLRKQFTEPRALAALWFPWQRPLPRLAPAAHFEQSECHWARAHQFRGIQFRGITGHSPDGLRRSANKVSAIWSRPAGLMYRVVWLLLAVVLAGNLQAADPPARPNLIWIMADDLGYGDLGCYGQKVIATPNLDQMAREGLRFTHYYAGATVCAPSRSVLMTGLHHGHTRVRGNAGKQNPAAQALRPDDVTVAKVLQQVGYRTALVGKWGLGDSGDADTGLPRKQGFDEFFGYLNQSHAHNHFPAFLWRNEDKISLPNIVTPVGDAGAGFATEAKVFADDLFADEAIRFVKENKSRPFYLYWSMLIPHANNERTRELKNGAQVPDFGPYADEDWPEQDKGQAAMISRLDGYVGRMLKTLREQGLADNTLVLFTSDNGPHNESNHNLKRFNPSGPFTGIKRSLTDGGIRVPMIAWWPNRIEQNTQTDHVAYFGDWMATATELSGATAIAGLDSISMVPTLLGKSDSQKQHDFLYWEFHEGGFKQAALYQGRWKGIRKGGVDAPIALYDQSTDIAESKNVADQYPEIVAKISVYLKTARTESIEWKPSW